MQQLQDLNIKSIKTYNRVYNMLLPMLKKKKDIHLRLNQTKCLILIYKSNFIWFNVISASIVMKYQYHGYTRI